MKSKESYKERVLDILYELRSDISGREIRRRLGGSPNYVKDALDYWVKHGYIQPPRGYSLSDSVIKQDGEYWLKDENGIPTRPYVASVRMTKAVSDGGRRGF